MRGKNVEIDIDFNLLDRFWLEAKGFLEREKNVKIGDQGKLKEFKLL